jgi:hypothetical protein
MQNNASAFQKKYYLMLCELHHPGRHGKDDNSDPHIESHYLVYDRFEPSTGISLCHLEEYEEYNTDDDSDDGESNILCNLNTEMDFLRNMYSNKTNFNPQYFGIHPTIRNYNNIISKPNYIKPEIGEYIILPTHESVAILKTFWLRIIQKKWKKVFHEHKNNKNIIPSIKGILSDLK